MAHDGPGPSRDASRVDRILADRPLLHPKYGEEQSDLGLTTFGTDEACYRLVDEHLFDGARTLETGLGLSTVLFIASGAFHTCAVSHQQEVDRLRAYCDQHGISLDRSTFLVGFSDDLLPGLAIEPLDVVFIDGGHGFPTPVLDWYYGAAHLKRGGLLVIDDIQLEAPRGLADYLDRDPRWDRLARTQKWAAYRRLSEGSLREDWVDQPFLRVRVSLRSRVGRLLRAAHLRS